MTGLLVLNGVTAIDGDTIVLRDIALSVAQGESLAVMGPPGAGKTALLATILGQTRLIDGEIDFGGRPIDQLPTHRVARLGIGHMPQTRAIFPSLTVEENLAIAVRRPTKKSDFALVHRLFPGLADARRRMGADLAPGERTILAMGRALMGQPGLLLLDDPLADLAQDEIAAVLNAVRTYRAETGGSAIVTGREWTQAMAGGGRAIAMANGRIAGTLKIGPKGTGPEGAEPEEPTPAPAA